MSFTKLIISGFLLVQVSPVLGQSTQMYELSHPSFQALMMSCDNKEAKSCYLAGKVFDSNGREKEAIKAYERGCSYGSESACDELHNPTYKNKSNQQTFRPRNSQNLDNYEYNLNKEENGLIDDFDSSELSLNLVTKLKQTPQYLSARHSCENNNLDSCFTLGKIHRKVGEDKNAEIIWKKLCDIKHADSCYELGVLGRKYDKPRVGDFYFQRGCDLGEPRSCKAIGLYHFYEKKSYMTRKTFSRWKTFEGLIGLANLSAKRRYHISNGIAWAPYLINYKDWWALTPRIGFYTLKDRDDDFALFAEASLDNLFFIKRTIVGPIFGWGGVITGADENALTVGFQAGYRWYNKEKRAAYNEKGIFLDRIVYRHTYTDSETEFYRGYLSLVFGI